MTHELHLQLCSQREMGSLTCASTYVSPGYARPGKPSRACWTRDVPFPKHLRLTNGEICSKHGLQENGEKFGQDFLEGNSTRKMGQGQRNISLTKASDALITARMVL